MIGVNDDQAYIDGSYYKIGLHGKAFILIDGYWYRSQKSVGEVIAASKKRNGGRG